MIPTAEGVVHEMVHAATSDSLAERFCEEKRRLHAAGAPVAESDRQEAVDPKRLTKTFVFGLLEETFTSGAPTLWQPGSLYPEARREYRGALRSSRLRGKAE